MKLLKILTSIVGNKKPPVAVFEFFAKKALSSNAAFLTLLLP
jgi:hypothetical protein